LRKLTTPNTKTGSPGFDQLFAGKAREGGRVRTGIVELDEMLHGGFMEGDAVMVAGSAGCGKTTLALQYLVNGVKNGDPGVYVTFEEMPDQIYRDANNFGWDLRRLEEQGKFKLICTSPSLLLESEGETLLDESLRDIQPKRMVVDSLSHLAMFVRESELRREAYRLVMHLKTRGISSVLIWESPQMSGSGFSVTDVGLSFLVDCIVALRPVEIESSLRKALAILKMRGSDHDKRLREFQITPNGIKIESAFSDYEGLMGGSPRKVPSEKFVDLFRGAAEKKR
jgi:circadian clock protein KaiC